jgi:hypothetical protein
MFEVRVNPCPLISEYYIILFKLILYVDNHPSSWAVLWGLLNQMMGRKLSQLE